MNALVEEQAENVINFFKAIMVPSSVHTPYRTILQIKHPSLTSCGRVVFIPTVKGRDRANVGSVRGCSGRFFGEGRTASSLSLSLMSSIVSL
jgi:hypothetical protein